MTSSFFIFSLLQNTQFMHAWVSKLYRLCCLHSVKANFIKYLNDKILKVILKCKHKSSKTHPPTYSSPDTLVSLLFFRHTGHIPPQGPCSGLSLCLTCSSLSYWHGLLPYLHLVFTHMSPDYHLKLQHPTPYDSFPSSCFIIVFFTLALIIL